MARRPGMVRCHKRHDNMLELLLPNDANKSCNPFLERRSQSNENRRPALGVAPFLALALENQNLRPGKGKKPANEIGRAILDGMHPSRWYFTLFDPLTPAILDEEQHLGGKVRAQFWQRAAARPRSCHIDPASLQVGQSSLVELLL